MTATIHAPQHLILHTPLVRRLCDGHVCELTFTVRAGVRRVDMAVRYVSTGTEIVVIAAAARHDPWWIAFRRSAPVELWLAGERRQGRGRAMSGTDPGWEQARLLYERHFPEPPVADADVFVVITLSPKPE